MFLPTGLGKMHTGTVCNELPAIVEEANTEALPEKIFAMLPVAPAELHRIALLLTRATCVLLVRVC